LILLEFNFEVEYRKGLVNVNADGLSRSPQPETEDNINARMHEDLLGGTNRGRPIGGVGAPGIECLGSGGTRGG
jgi:hypothetical protein